MGRSAAQPPKLLLPVGISTSSNTWLLRPTWVTIHVDKYAWMLRAHLGHSYKFQVSLKSVRGFEAPRGRTLLIPINYLYYCYRVVHFVSSELTAYGPSGRGRLRSPWAAMERHHDRGAPWKTRSVDQLVLECSLSPRKSGNMFSPALVCVCVCLSVCVSVCDHDN